MFQGFGLHSLHQQHMTQIGFTSGVVINPPGCYGRWQKIYQNSRQGFGPPVPAPVISGDSAWGHDHKIPHSRDKRFIKIRVKGLGPPCPHRFLQNCFSLFAFSFADPGPVLTYSNIISKRGRNYSAYVFMDDLADKFPWVELHNPKTGS